MTFSSPIAAGCEESVLRLFESDSSPTPAVFFGECRLKSCATKRPSDDDDSALPPRHTRGTHTIDQYQSQGEMSRMDQDGGVNAQERDDNEHTIQQVPIDTFGPSYDASLTFVSTRSLGIAPPSTPSPKHRSFLFNTTQENRPLHLAAASSALTIPSSADYMDTSPESIVRIADSYAERNQPRAHLIDDPFKGSFDNNCQNSLNLSPIISGAREMDIELLSQTRKQSTVSLESPHAFFGRSKCSALTGEMDIDSPGYHMRTIPRDPEGSDPRPCPSSDVDYSNAAEFVQPPSRSASQGSIGKRTRMDEDEESYRPSSSSGFSRPSSGHRSYPSTLKFIKPHQPSSAAPFENSNLFSPEPLLSSPTDEASPCVNMFSRKAVHHASAASPISTFCFPASKSNLHPENHPSISHKYKCDTESDANRATSKVAQSSAALFNRHRISLSANFDVKSLEDGSALLSSTRPVSSSHNRITNLESSSHGIAEDVEQTEEPEDMNVNMALSCSSPSRSFTTSERSIFSNMSSKNSFKKSKSISSCSNESKASRCAAPLSLNYLQPLALNSMSAPESPTGSFIFTLGSTIKSPVGMAFSEKERAGKILPCHKVSSDGLMRISPQTMDKVLQGAYDESISRKMIIDCRFGYEYEGGHIRDAINLQDKETLETMLLHGGLFAGGKNDVPIPSESGKPDVNGETKKVVLIFHCEYSAMRAPAVAKYLREKDRHMNMSHYPALHYPEIYILEGGYAKYHSHSPQYCSGNYVQMDDPSHRSDRHTDLNLFRTRESAVFSRAKSFTYGESKPTKHNKKNIKTSAGLSRFGIGNKLDLLSEDRKENTPTRNRIIEEEDDFEKDDSLQASSPLYGVIAGPIHSKKPSLKSQGRSISMLAQVEQNQPRGINDKTNIFN